MKPLHLKLVLEAFDKITAPVRRLSARFTAEMKSMMKAAKDLSASLTKIGESLNKVGTRIRKVGGDLTRWVTAPLGALGIASVVTSANVEDLTVKLSGMVGGLDEARALIAELYPLADQLGISLESASIAAGALMAAGYKGNNLSEQMRRIASIAAGSRAGIEQLAEIASKSRNAGKFDGGDIEALAKAGVPVIETLMELLGKTRSQVMKLAADGRITAKDMERAFGRMTAAGGVFEKSMEQRGRTLAGVWGQFVQSMRHVFDDLGRTLIDELDIASKLESVTVFVRRLADAFLKLPKPVRSGLVYLALFAAAIGPLVMMLGQLVITVGGMILVFAKIAPALTIVIGLFRALSVALLTTPFGWVVLAVTAVAGAAYLLIKNWSKVSAFFRGVWDGVKTAFKEGIDWVLDKLSPLISAVKFVAGGIGRIRNAWNNSPAVRFVRAGGGAPSTPEQSSPAVPAAAGLAAQKVDAGGTLKIIVEADGRPRVTESRPNDRRMDWQTNTGLLMGGY